MAKKKQNLIGSLSFILGLLIAAVIGLFSDSIVNSSLLVGVVMLLGLIAGFMNINAKETTPFLVASVALVIVSYAGSRTLDITASAALSDFVGNTLKAIMLFVLPATVIVALKAIYVLESN